MCFCWLVLFHLHNWDKAFGSKARVPSIKAGIGIQK